MHSKARKLAKKCSVCVSAKRPKSAIRTDRCQKEETNTTHSGKTWRLKCQTEERETRKKWRRETNLSPEAIENSSHKNRQPRPRRRWWWRANKKLNSLLWLKSNYSVHFCLRVRSENFHFSFFLFSFFSDRIILIRTESWLKFWQIRCFMGKIFFFFWTKHCMSTGKNFFWPTISDRRITFDIH